MGWSLRDEFERETDIAGRFRRSIDIGGQIGAALDFGTIVRQALEPFAPDDPDEFFDSVQARREKERAQRRHNG